MKRKIYRNGERRFYAYEMRIPFVIETGDLALAVAEHCENHGGDQPTTRQAVIDIQRNYLANYGGLPIDIDKPDEGEPDGYDVAIALVDRLFPELAESPDPAR